jgi:eukaryotic-like serine/threonine-protein kinase
VCDQGDASGASERFIREARLARRIQHTNVATLYDFAPLCDGAFYMVWELIDGVNLRELIRVNGKLAPERVARLSIDAWHGLQAIHDAGVIHRDISPDNRISLARFTSMPSTCYG